MSTIAHALLQSQQMAHDAAIRQRLMLTEPAKYDTPMNRADVLDTLAMSRDMAANFALGASMHQAANEPFAPEAA